MENIVVNDGKTTPASHTFAPQQGQKGAEPAQWYERSTASSQGWNRVDTRVDLLPSPVKGGNHTSRLQLHIPVISTDENGVETLIGVRKYFVTSVIPYGLNQVSALQSDFGLLRNLLGNAQVAGGFISQLPNG